MTIHEPDNLEPPPFANHWDKLLDAFQGITPIDYDPVRRLVRWYVGRLQGEAVTLSWETALIAAELLKRAAEKGRKHSADCPTPSQVETPEPAPPKPKRVKPKPEPAEVSGNLFD